MIAKSRSIAPSQLMLVLFVSRLFSLLLYVPRTHSSAGQSALLAVPLGAVFALALLLPWALLKRRAPSPLVAARRAGAPFSYVVALLLGLYALMLAAYSLRGFSLFMTSTAYPNAPAWIFILFLGAVAAYGARMGLEALARTGFFVFLLVCLSLLVLCLFVMPLVRVQRLTNPLMQGWMPVLQGAWRGMAAFADLPLFLILAARVPKKAGWCAGGWILLSGAVFTVMALVCVLVLGEQYGSTRLFVLHTLSSVAGSSALGRLDLLFLLMWVFTAFTRAALCLYCGCVCLRVIFTKLSLRGAAAVCFVISGAVATTFARVTIFWTRLEEMMATGVPMLVLMVALPLLMLAFGKKKMPVQKQEGRWFGAMPEHVRLLHVNRIQENQADKGGKS